MADPTQTTDRVAIITITVPDDVGLALNLHDGIQAFVSHAVPDFRGAVSLRFEGGPNG